MLRQVVHVALLLLECKDSEVDQGILQCLCTLSEQGDLSHLFRLLLSFASQTSLFFELIFIAPSSREFICSDELFSLVLRLVNSPESTLQLKMLETVRNVSLQGSS